MKPLILGIDPGANGAIVELWPDGKTFSFASMDDPDLVDYLRHRGLGQLDVMPLVAYLEQVGGYIGKAQPGSSMFKFGDGYGFIRGVLAARGIKTVLVRPQTWQKGIPGLSGATGPARKRALKEHAARLFPDVKVTLGNADALLIADYGRKHET